MRIGVVGAGGVGGHFAARWFEQGHEVTVVARGAHGEAIAETGLQLHSFLGDTRAWPKVVSDLSQVPELDCLVFATKTYQLSVAADAASRVPGQPVVFGLQNGVTAASLLRQALPQSIVLGGTCRVISLIESPGTIRHLGVQPSILIGGQDSVSRDRAQDLAKALSCPGKLSVEASERIDYELWSKFLFFAPISGIGSVSGLTIGELRKDPVWRHRLENAVSEVARVSDKLGIALGEEAVVRTMDFVDQLPASGTSSMQRDIEAGRPHELAELSGRVVQFGKDLGVETPTHSWVLEQLR